MAVIAMRVRLKDRGICKGDAHPMDCACSYCFTMKINGCHTH